jgi:hypothetical protein
LISDWNWFFSSLAQSVAALVGVMAAFMIASLLNNQAEFSRKVARTEELLIGAERLRDSAGIRFFAWYNRQQNKEALESVINHMGDLPELSVEQHYARWGFSKYSPREEVLRSIDETLKRERQLRAAKQKQASIGGLGGIGGFEVPDIKPITSIVSTTAHRQQMSDEGEELDRLRVEVSHHARLIATHLAKIERNPERSSVIAATLGACALLFVAGIVYPLSFLPVRPGETFRLSILAFFEILFSLRGVLLSIVAVVFLALLGVFYRINEGMQHDRAQIAKLRDAGSLGWYSRFFAVAEANRLAAIGAALDKQSQ